MLRILLSAFMLVALFFVKCPYLFLLYLVPYIIIGGDILLRAAKNILRGRVFDENFLMALATVGAFILGEYAEALAVMLFYQVGELFQSYALGRSRRSIRSLLDLKPDVAYVEKDGEIIAISPEAVSVGDVIVVRPGQRLPLDGVVTEGISSLDTAALTGESLPRSVEPGSQVQSGCLNQSGLLSVRVTKPAEESTVAKILELVENADSKKTNAERFITRFARYYTPFVVIAALLLALVPPLILGNPFSLWLQRALIFLVVSCPCALVLSVPLSFFGGIGGASRQGILIKGSNFLEALSKAEIMVFDKTGTLTEGNFIVTEICPAAMEKHKLLEIAALAEGYSLHPIADSIRKAWGKALDQSRVTETEEIPGKGILATIDGKKVLAGNEALMAEFSIKHKPVSAVSTHVHIAIDGDYAGYLTIADRVKPEAKEALSALKALGIQKTVMLSGDSPAVCRAVGKELALDRVFAGLLPTDKVKMAERLGNETTKGTLVYVGDGMNDAPVLARADVGIAMGAMGQDAAIEASDVVLMDDKLSKLSRAIKIAKKTMAIVRQNIVFSLSVKALVLCLGALGFANMWLAVFADVGVSVLAILNAMRALQKIS